MEPLVSQFESEINQVIDRYRDQGLTMAEAVGTLSLARAKLEHEALEDEDDE